MKALLIAVLALAAPSAHAVDKIFPVLGVTAAATGGGRAHLGPDFSLLFGSCRDACSGVGPTAGVVDFRTGEYFAGLAFGAAYFGSVWADYAARFKEGQVSGHHVSLALGWGLMAFGALTTDVGSQRLHFELGFTGKIPFAID